MFPIVVENGDHDHLPLPLHWCSIQPSLIKPMPRDILFIAIEAQAFSLLIPILSAYDSFKIWPNIHLISSFNLSSWRGIKSPTAMSIADLGCWLSLCSSCSVQCGSWVLAKSFLPLKHRPSLLQSILFHNNRATPMASIKIHGCLILPSKRML